jgi:hypothetical protein
VAVGSAIAVLETKALRRRAGDDDLTVVHRAVMGRTEHDEVICVVLAAVRAGLDVMHVDEGRVPAPGDDAAALVAAEHVSADRGRYCLCGAVEGLCFGRTHVGLSCAGRGRVGVNRVGLSRKPKCRCTLERIARSKARPSRPSSSLRSPAS